MTIKLYGLNQCSTVAKAKAWLDAHSVQYEFQDYRAVPVPPATLKKWAKELGGWEKLVNRASMTWRNLDESLKTPDSDAQWLALIADYPAMVRRPVLVDASGAVSVGFNEKRYAAQFG
ncbi:Spx/MgsR family RNA polymerase-binding regulatory protein [Orrella sp. NBD-18]|uniref:Spx/MgsR family RNA polymerase-binding regulatory protein n=1 Tax=Sheuella amnicola TaxID=2707330 RepID=A0A6B2R2N2_9BURK|nr:Spx/MgsR family RNA polymerase-binding regulatory protein [Sheuella amnicola]NDY83914.1 Spx/MgsR family RNA polymerase-binding regulatory protein [Sheuella amnicola]HBI82266.1 arsenate reductase [Alcaligenaceae bacterium]